MDDHFLRRQQERKRQERIKKAKRKNIIIFIETLIIAVLTVALVVVSVKYASLKGNASLNPSGDNSNSSVASGTASSDTASADLLKAELDKWYMKLVNPDNSVDQSFISNVDLTEINSKYTSGSQSSKMMDTRVVESFENMCKAAANAGITLISISAYRTYSYQSTLYNNRVQRCINEGMTRAEAEKKAATIVALPGTSEHHLGLAVDINSVETSFEDTAAFRWLQENAENYGFILRYPKDKQEITKIIYEPWHYRYVGVEHAKTINGLGMCFEEYVEYLSNGGVK